MAVTLNNIKFYRPPSLPARPMKSTYPNHQHPSFSRHSEKPDHTPSTHPNSPLSFSQPLLRHSLPPRPPIIVPSSRSAETLHISSTSSSANSPPVHENDFDRALDDLFSAKNGKENEDGESSRHIPIQDRGIDNILYAISPDPEKPSQIATDLVSSGVTALKPPESSADAKPTQPTTQDESQPRDELNGLALTASTDTTSAFCTSEPPTSTSNKLNPGSTGAAIEASTEDASIVDRERSEAPHTSRVLSQSPKSGGCALGSGSNDVQGASGDSKRANLCQLEESSNRKRRPSARLPCPPTPQVVVSVPSRSVSLRRESSRRGSHHSHCSDRIVEDSHESDSAPSDDENDTDYLDHSEREEAGESFHPSKRRRRSLVKGSSASRGVSRQLSSESPRAKRPESLPEDLCAESEPIPIQGFLRLRSRGPKVTYCLEFSQEHFPSSIASREIQPPRPHRRRGRPATRTSFTPDENEFIIKLKAQELSWAKIEDLFAQRFPYRKKSSLQVHYYTKLKGSVNKGKGKKAG